LPFRELIQKSDNLIKDANSFLIVGFGFNDEHLTPEIEKKIRKGAPIVLITKNVSPSSFIVLENELFQLYRYLFCYLPL
jgi:hypothetical protein